MNKRIKRDGDVRLMDREALAAYLSLGLKGADAFASKVGAKRKIGKNALYDKAVIDEALNSLAKIEKEDLPGGDQDE